MKYVFLSLLIFFNYSIYCQLFDDPNQISTSLSNQRSGLLVDKDFMIGYNVGLTCHLGQNNITELRFNFSIGVSRAYGWKSAEYAPFLSTYQLQIEAFRGGVGSSLYAGNRSKFIWDLRNVLQINSGVVSNNIVNGRPLTKLVGSSEYGIRDPYDYSIGLGTIFINGLNHDRNQQAGFISFGIDAISACYLNDGPFFNVLGLGDGYDRWWTGAGYIGVYFLNNFGFITDISIQYQRYTGWQPNLYEMTNMLGIDYLSYINVEEQFFNQGAYTLSFGIRNSIRLDAKVFEPKKLDVQNLLHVRNRYSFHPNLLIRRFTLGGGFNLDGCQNINH